MGRLGSNGLVEAGIDACVIVATGHKAPACRQQYLHTRRPLIEISRYALRHKRQSCCSPPFKIVVHPTGSSAAGPEYMNVGVYIRLSQVFDGS